MLEFAARMFCLSILSFDVLFINKDADVNNALKIFLKLCEKSLFGIICLKDWRFLKCSIFRTNQKTLENSKFEIRNKDS